MAEDVLITPGAGALIGTDEIVINGVLAHVERLKTMSVLVEGFPWLGDVGPANNINVSGYVGPHDLTLSSSPKVVMGYTMMESMIPNDFCSFQLLDGANPVVFVALAHNETVRDWFGPSGIRFSTNVIMRQITGECNGTLFVQ